MSELATKKARIVARLKAAGINFSFTDSYEALLEKLVGVKPVITATAPSAVAAADATDLATVITLANEIKADFNAMRTYLLEVTADLTA